MKKKNIKKNNINKKFIYNKKYIKKYNNKPIVSKFIKSTYSKNKKYKLEFFKIKTKEFLIISEIYKKYKFNKLYFKSFKIFLNKDDIYNFQNTLGEIIKNFYEKK
ncbi:MAG: hypothetical protein ABPD24_00280 [Candidatus Shikimatogenerans sp. AspAUS03]|uniref:Uncharacterized protein n=1 Tax=Candidatus Shikimatogenerans sp. AspAUS03 TaxID=3158563 RepID=A0AAU7QVH3_9FLAO